MHFLKKTILPIALSSIWISISEFVRNEFIVKHLWVEHYKQLGLSFPSAPLNGIIWGVWSMFLAIAIFIIYKRFSLFETTFLSWLVGFVLMWLVIGNMGVLPNTLLYYAIPLSIVEVFIAACIIKKLH